MAQVCCNGFMWYLQRKEDRLWGKCMVLIKTKFASSKVIDQRYIVKKMQRKEEE